MSRLPTPDNEVKRQRVTERRISALERSETAPVAAGAGDRTLTYIQNSAALVWNISHGMNKYPAVQVIDATGSLVLADVTWPDANNVRVTFGRATAGRAFIN